jgi:hypothetical protein
MIAEEHCTPIERLRREKIPLHGIWRALGLGLKLFIFFMGIYFDAAHVKP